MEEIFSCTDCERYLDCTRLCPRAERYANQDFVGPVEWVEFKEDRARVAGSIWDQIRPEEPAIPLTQAEERQLGRAFKVLVKKYPDHGIQFYQHGAEMLVEFWEGRLPWLDERGFFNRLECWQSLIDHKALPAKKKGIEWDDDEETEEEQDARESTLSAEEHHRHLDERCKPPEAQPFKGRKKVLRPAVLAYQRERFTEHHRLDDFHPERVVSLEVRSHTMPWELVRMIRGNGSLTPDECELFDERIARNISVETLATLKNMPVDAVQRAVRLLRGKINRRVGYYQRVLNKNRLWARSEAFAVKFPQKHRRKHPYSLRKPKTSKKYATQVHNSEAKSQISV